MGGGEVAGQLCAAMNSPAESRNDFRSNDEFLDFAVWGERGSRTESRRTVEGTIGQNSTAMLTV